MQNKSFTIAIIGMGPRGVSIIERIAAQEIDLPVQLVLIDDAQIGAGRVWDTAQTHLLCMNTLAGAVTLFTEPGATVEAPVLEGPTMYEWIQAIRGEDIPAPKAALVARYPISVDASFTAEIAATRPESNPSRALYGAYIRWVYQVALGQLPDTVTVAEYNARALSIRQSPSAPNADVIMLSDGQEITAHATVMATGWQRPQLEDYSEFGLWVGPDNPVEQDLSRIPAGKEVLVRGLGMGFFDVMALLSVGRGGRFIDDPHARSGLRYEPSGQEPKLGGDLWARLSVPAEERISLTAAGGHPVPVEVGGQRLVRAIRHRLQCPGVAGDRRRLL